MESNFEKWKEDNASGYGDYEFERKGTMVAFKAMPVKNIVAIIDDADATMPYRFKEDVWNAGYDLTFTAADDTLPQSILPTIPQMNSTLQIIWTVKK